MYLEFSITMLTTYNITSRINRDVAASYIYIAPAFQYIWALFSGVHPHITAINSTADLEQPHHLQPKLQSGTY